MEAEAAEIEFDEPLRAMAMSYLRKNYWRIASVCDKEDLPSEALWVFWYLKRKYPDVSREEFTKLYRSKLKFHVLSKSLGCFPNPYNLSKNPVGKCISITEMEDSGGLLERLAPTVASFSSEVEEYLDILSKMPDELKNVCAALIREAMGLENIPGLANGLRSRSRKLVESINNETLCRLFKLDKGRDLFAELGKAYHHLKGNGEEPLALENEVLTAVKLKRKPKENDQKFLRRVVETIDEWDDEEFNQLSEAAQVWHDKAVLAIQNGEDIQPLTDGAKPMAKTKEAKVVDEDEDLDTDVEDVDDDEEEEVEQKPARKARAGAGAIAGRESKAAAKERSPNGRGTRGGRPRRITTEMREKKIKVLTENPHREGSKAYANFQLAKKAGTVAEYLNQGGDVGYLLGYVERECAKLVD